MDKGYIYIFNHSSYGDTFKLGIASNIPSRENTYNTGHLEPGKFGKIYEVNRAKMAEIENKIHKDHTKYHVYRGGGNEFYGKDLIPILDKYFDENNIEYRVLSNDEISSLRNRTAEDKKGKQPLDFQKKIIKRAKKYFSKNRKGKLICACGSGKTLMGFWIFKKLNVYKVLILVPTLDLLQQTYSAWLAESKARDMDCKFLLIGSTSGATTNQEKINTETQESEDEISRKVVISTYQSFGLIKNKRFDFIIYDEAHRTVGPEQKLFAGSIQAKSKMKLFMTATEKFYDAFDNATSMDSQILYGDTIYNYSFGRAIEDNRLCDYKIVMCYSALSLQSEKYNITAKQIVDFISKNYPKHMILYCSKKKNADKISECIDKVLEKFPIKDLYKTTITGDDIQTKRAKEIKKFETSNAGIICSVKVFTEGINIEVCDSICFVDNKTSSIDVVQCFGRCVRKMRNCPKCAGNITHCQCWTEEQRHRFAAKIGYVLLPLIVGENEDIFNNGNKKYAEIRRILKIIWETDSSISQKVSLTNFGHSGKKIAMGICQNEEDLCDSIVSKIFDHFSEKELLRRKIIRENRRLRKNNEPLIDSKKKCLAYLVKNKIEYELNVNNWIKFCLGSMFPEYLGKFYIKQEDIEASFSKLGINSLEKYEALYAKDPKLPNLEMINDGFYFDTEINILKMFNGNITF